jgi:Putative peptidoglycan binding domain
LGRFGKQLTSDSKQTHFDDVTVVTAPLKQEQQSFRWSIGIKMRDDSGHPVARRGGRCGFGVPYASPRVDQPRDGPNETSNRGAGLNLQRTVKFVVPMGLGLLLAVAPASAKSSKSSKTTSSKSHAAASKSSSSKSSKSSLKKTSSKSSKKTKGGWRTRGQQAIDTNRAREIQAALVRAHYLDGAPTGTWDARSKAAMEKFQGDNGWQTKKIPDARALIKLGLGPDHSDLINPNTASIATPDTVKGGGVPSNPQR